MQKYRDWWPLLDEMPQGWKIDKTVGSPLAGYVFVTNGKSVFDGQIRALLRVKKQQAELFAQDAPRIEAKPANTASSPQKKPEWVIDAGSARTVNELAREKFKQRLLADILTDLMICEIEGWCKLEYINQMKALINSIAQSECIDV